MIREIFLHEVATFNNINFLPSKINYIYGGNGTGKTTLSKVIANNLVYPKCKIDISDNSIDRCIYNRDFVKEHFSQSSSVKGIFTLGKETKEAQEYIENKKAELDRLKQNEKGSNEKIIELKEKIDIARKSFEEKTWAIKKKYEVAFGVAFKGYMGSKEAFLEKCLDEKNNSSELLRFDILNEKRNILFDKKPVRFEQLTSIDTQEIIGFERSDLLSTPIIGKEEAQVGALINKLHNSDWVNNGRKYMDIDGSKCPFCQQPLTDEIKNNIEDFFDESYENQKNLLQKFRVDYESHIKLIFDNLQSLREKDINIIDFSTLDEKEELLEERHKMNLLRIDKKISSPSNCEELEVLSDILSDINDSINVFKAIITKNNQLVDNLESEKNRFKKEIWKFITDELKIQIFEFDKKVSGLSKGITSISKTIIDIRKESELLDRDIKAKEAEITSTKHTKNEINRILKNFGFTGFIIDDADAKGSYKIVRLDGRCVEETLSEGEYTFITFLYFYQMIKGSLDSTGITRDKIIVIDDPISSLDSNVLFVVSHLVKDVIDDCNNKKSGIRQVFILTHNIYFHKEVTFRGNRYHHKQHEKFWIIMKINERSSFKEFNENPIKTTYEMLWRELDHPENVNTSTIFNTLRRILEYYFTIIGGIDYENCIHSFEGEDKLVCKALVSWINDGSHFINDDMIMYVDPESVEKYLRVFKLIFDNMGHSSHYNMMMKIG